jgi:hypothetical protein
VAHRGRQPVGGSLPDREHPDRHHAQGSHDLLPCLDEAEDLRDAVRYATEAAERCAITHGIVIVDDGSTDTTVAVAGTLAVTTPEVPRLILTVRGAGYRIGEL